MLGAFRHGHGLSRSLLMGSNSQINEDGPGSSVHWKAVSGESCSFSFVTNQVFLKLLLSFN